MDFPKETAIVITILASGNPKAERVFREITTPMNYRKKMHKKNSHIIKFNIKRAKECYEYEFAIAKRLNLSEENLDLIVQHYPEFWLNIVLMEIARDMDDKYPDHIRDCENLYCINKVTFKPEYLPFAQDFLHYNYTKNMTPMFRTIEEATAAIAIAGPLIKKVKLHGKKKDS